MNDTTDPAQQINNASYLRDNLAGDNWFVNPMKIKYRNPAMKEAEEEARAEAMLRALEYQSLSPFPSPVLPQVFYTDPDLNFDEAKAQYLNRLDEMVADAQARMDAGESFRLFPPVRAGHRETLPNSIPWWNWTGKVRNDEPNLAKLIQHLVGNVTDGLEKTFDQDKKALQEFVEECG